MNELREATELSLEPLIVRLALIDIVIAEGFKTAAIPTMEICVPLSGREGRWTKYPNIIALVYNDELDLSLSRFGFDEVAVLAEHVATVPALSRHL